MGGEIVPFIYRSDPIRHYPCRGASGVMKQTYPMR